MQKLIKLSAVSMLAIMTVNGANAAGYTCEELIEYTSCNTGYYLNDGECIEGTTCGAGNYLSACPSGYKLYTGYCGTTGMNPWSISEISGYTYEECAEAAAENGQEPYYLSRACGIEYGYNGEDSLEYDIQEAGDVTCTACPAGTYQNAAGQYECIECPDGSYCAGTGLTAVSGKCADGTYSGAGASACSTCPATGLTDSSGNSVVAITGMTGATSAAACYVSPNTSFADAKGIYRYKTNCSLRIWELELDTEEKCTEFGLEWADGTFGDFAACVVVGEEASMIAFNSMVDTEAKCSAMANATGMDLEWNYDGGIGECKCSDGDMIMYRDGWECLQTEES